MLFLKNYSKPGIGKGLKIKKPSRQVRKAYMITYIFAVSYLSFPTRAGLNVAPYLAEMLDRLPRRHRVNSLSLSG